MNIKYEKMSTIDITGAVILFRKLVEEASEVSFSEVENEKQLLDWLQNPNYYLFVAKEDNEVVAVFRCSRGEGAKKHSGLLTIAVDPAYRGKHIASSFTLYCLEELKKSGIKLARAYIYSDNKPSINTILACGFSVSGCVYQHHYNDKKGIYVDDIIFHKLL
ncbi:GNAT family N-acetyltransferase [Alkaliphilus peptidifermentans]|uniref:Acetyltransferase (GNAT) domain-containing protein n=1 Tax=Alkaliphilus peptidifermentans DSM 18978 TaxID=1120976 RepID=A0A1G5KA73_9FIRM|nr:GNAT family N-acetyltransferase [Alkaliphilus peptidifermentans]SCY97506.1 Acetyltransferase (GNAT) domain-containing protein [Alkaliphilus peptidifermentans DSM 18978]